MIVNLLINFVIGAFGLLFAFFPIVHLSGIPIVGTYLVSWMSIGVHFWNTFIQLFPFALLPWHMTVWVILPFELILLVAKFFLHHRVPANLN
jgi:hypothetical protein